MLRLTIRGKILLGFMAATVLPVFLLGFLNVLNAQRTLRMQQFESLDAIADLKQQRIEGFFEEIAADARLVSDLGIVRGVLPVITERLGDFESEDYRDARRVLDGELLGLRENRDYLEIILADQAGRMV